MSEHLNSLRQHVEFLASPECEGRAPGTSGGLRAREYVLGQFEERGLQPAAVDRFVQPLPAIGGANLVGQITGRGNRYILVAAHYDHLGIHLGKVHPGADDNASGVSVLLNLADRLLENQSELGRNVLIVSFDAEEPPHFYTENMGSVWFVANPTVPLDRIDLMICLDLVGHPLGTAELPDEVRNSLFVLGAERSGIGPLVDECSNGQVCLRRLDADVVPPMSDHYAFERADVPFLFITAGRDRNYHTPQDTPEKLDYSKLAALTEALNQLVVEVSQRPEPLTHDSSITDDLATLDSLLTLGLPLIDRLPRGERTLALTKGLYAKAARGKELSAIDRGSLRALIDQYQRVLA